MSTADDGLAYRLWCLRRRAVRTGLRALGVGAAVWREGEPLGLQLEAVGAFRRAARDQLTV